MTKIDEYIYSIAKQEFRKGNINEKIVKRFNLPFPIDTIDNIWYTVMEGVLRL